MSSREPSLAAMEPHDDFNASSVLLHLREDLWAAVRPFAWDEDRFTWDRSLPLGDDALAPPVPDGEDGSGFAAAAAAAAQPPVTNVAASGNVDIDSLLAAVKWGGAVHTGVTLTYSFENATSTYQAGEHEPTNGFHELTDAQKAAARTALQFWSNVANVKFVEVADNAAGHGDIRFGRSNDPATAHAYYPGSSDIAGDIWLGNTYHTDTASYPLGSYNFRTFTHEIGHALGLKHPHDTGGTGVVQNAANDWFETSLMSYRTYPNQPVDQGDSATFGPSAPMLNDIAAIQYLYGANTAFHGGNDVYSWAPGARLCETIYDSGGVDTIDWSNQSSAAVIDLHAGAWSNLGPAYSWYGGGGGSLPTTLAIARNTVIENANGGSGADLVIGNDGVNTLAGNAGDDILRGGLGNDRLDGGAGNDKADYSDAGAAVTVNLATGVSSGGAGADTLANIEYVLGSRFNDTLTGNGGDNVLQGGLGSDRLYGGAGIDFVSFSLVTTAVTASLATHTATGEGTDTLGTDIEALAGGTAGDTLTGDAGANQLRGLGGNDLIHGGAGNDVVDGDSGDDVLFGDDGNDVMLGDDGNETMTGGAGKDNMTGGVGADRFVFTLTTESPATSGGRDLITDFNHGQGDRIDLAAIDANGSAAGNQAFTFNGTSALTALGQVHYFYSGADTIIEANTLGSTAPELQIQLTGHVALVAGDFLL